MDKSGSPDNNYVSIYTNNQQTGDQFPPSSGSVFSTSTTISPSSELIVELLAIHKKRSRTQVMYMSIIFAIFGVIGLIIFGVSFTQPECNQLFENCTNLRLSLFIIGLTFAGSAVFIILLVLCIWSCQMSSQWGDFHQRAGQDQLFAWRLNGGEWQRFLDYIHGPNRQWRDVAPLSSFCCRRATYERLSDRQYGHIIFYNNGFIIDELYFISFRLYTLLGTEILNLGSNPSTLGLRINTYLQAGKNSRYISFDLFAPSSVTQEQLVALTQWYSRGASVAYRPNMIV